MPTDKKGQIIDKTKKAADSVVLNSKNVSGKLNLCEVFGLLLPAAATSPLPKTTPPPATPPQPPAAEAAKPASPAQDGGEVIAIGFQ